ICNYLYELAQKFNSFYSKHKILVDDPLVLEFRVRLASATGTVLKSGLNLLGIDSPERM
ncbi:MAG: Arginine-tRNA ligase, partial [Microgenomates group bacterium GW2011_GWF1_38_5]